MGDHVSHGQACLGNANRCRVEKLDTFYLTLTLTRFIIGIPNLSTNEESSVRSLGFPQPFIALAASHSFPLTHSCLSTPCSAFWGGARVGAAGERMARHGNHTARPLRLHAPVPVPVGGPSRVYGIDKFT